MGSVRLGDSGLPGQLAPLTMVLAWALCSAVNSQNPSLSLFFMSERVGVDCQVDNSFDSAFVPHPKKGP